jgi:hypothetical protein
MTVDDGIYKVFAHITYDVKFIDKKELFNHFNDVNFYSDVPYWFSSTLSLMAVFSIMKTHSQ